VGALALVPVLFYLFMVLRFWGMLQDDSYIGFRYVDNLLRGNGLVFNPGERVEAFSSPLWLLLTALLSPLLSRPTAAKVLGVSSGLATGLVIFLWIRQLAARQGFSARQCRLAAAMSLGFFFCDFGVVYYSISGLETILCGLLATLSAIAVYEELRTRKVRYSWLFLGLNVWTRPEAILLCLLAVAVMAVAGVDRRQLARLIVLTALFVVPLYVCRRMIYGQWQTNTYAAKVHFGVDSLKLAADYLLPCLYHYGKPVVLIFLILGLRVGLRRWGAAGVAALTLPLVVVLALVVLAGGDWMGYLRFLVPAFGSVAIFAGLGAASVVGNRRFDLFQAVFPGCVLVLLLAAATLSARKMAEEEGAPVFSGPSALWKGGHDSRSQTVIADWVREHVARHQWVAYGDMGIVPYLNPEINFIDYHGLITPEVSHLKNVKRNVTGVWDDESDANNPVGQLLLKKRPEYILTMLRAKGRFPIGSRAFSGAYETVDAISLEASGNDPSLCIYAFKRIDR
jgi:hypothetical protein